MIFLYIEVCYTCTARSISNYVTFYSFHEIGSVLMVKVTNITLNTLYEHRRDPLSYSYVHWLFFLLLKMTSGVP